MIRGRTFTTRLALALALAVLLLGFGGFVAVLSRDVVSEHQDEALRLLSKGLAQHIVEHWPEITVADRDQADREARGALLSMLMVVNPGVQVYLLDPDGHVSAYIGQPGMVRRDQVDLGPVRRFLAGAPLPLRGSDPMGSAKPRLFSAAMFPPRASDVRPPGYLYIVLDGAPRDLAAAQISDRRIWRGAITVTAAGLLAVLAVGLFVFHRLTQPLQRLATRISAYSAGRTVAGAPSGLGVGDEVQAIDAAFGEMTRRIEAQARREREQSHAHRETMASVAHDLRTPLTALHGHLEALGGALLAAQEDRQHVLATALAQSDKVRRLSQQLFELAALQSGDQPLHTERFRLDELVTDTVQKFCVSRRPYPVRLGGPASGPLEIVGDLHLIERALTNLIENALRHAATPTPVLVSLRPAGDVVHILVEDHGPGLPAELSLRLERGQSVRDPPIPRPGGSIGGLGLAIAQRVAILHGGTLRAFTASDHGTRLCLALPKTQ